MKKKKLAFQAVVCALIVLSVFCFSKSDNIFINKIKTELKSQVMTELTLDEIKATGRQLSASLFKAPEKLVAAVSSANSASKYGKPIDEKSKTRFQQVHAAAGGMVISSGKNDELGLFIKIKHEKAVSVYGHLYNIQVVESERVQRGEIIGSFDTESEKEFYYDLKEKL